MELFESESFMVLQINLLVFVAEAQLFSVVLGAIGVRRIATKRGRIVRCSKSAQQQTLHP